MSDKTVTIGVLALQGAFIEHITYLLHSLPSSSPYTLDAIPVRSPSELARCAGLVIPGGESTVIQSVAERTPGMLPALLDFVRDPSKPVWGTCAGMILLAEEDGVGGGKVIPGRERQKGWGGIEGLRVWRNLYGTQLESFEAPLTIPELSNPTEPFNAIFIRAPAVHSLRPSSSGLVDHTTSISPSSISGTSSPSSSSTCTAPTAPTPTPASAVPSYFSSGVSQVNGLDTPSPTPPRTPKPDAPSNTGAVRASGGRGPPVVALATLPAQFHPAPPPADSHLGPSNPDDLGTVMLRQGKKMVTSFHPELSGDVRVHRYWVEKCVLGL